MTTIAEDMIRDALLAAEASLSRSGDSVTLALVKRALSVQAKPYATAAEMAGQVGGKWVVHARTKNIVERYDEDVICLSKKQYEAAERRALEART